MVSLPMKILRDGPGGANDAEGAWSVEKARKDARRCVREERECWKPASRTEVAMPVLRISICNLSDTDKSTEKGTRLTFQGRAPASAYCPFRQSRTPRQFSNDHRATMSAGCHVESQCLAVAAHLQHERIPLRPPHTIILGLHNSVECVGRFGLFFLVPCRIVDAFILNLSSGHSKGV